MAVLVLTHAEIERLLPMGECVDLMAEALAELDRDEAHNPLRSVVRPPAAPGLIGLMPAHGAAGYGLKAIVVTPDNPKRGLDAHQGAVLLFDGETGEVLAVMNASAITAIRTAAVSGVATRLLARPGARTVAILGAGVQARVHVEAMRSVLVEPEIAIWSRRCEAAESLAATAGARAAESCEAALAGADVVCTTTSAREPIVRREWLAPGAHVNAVGSSIPTARELDTATVAGSSLYVDRRESTLNEAGDYLLPAREGAIGPDHIRAELGELLNGRARGRTSSDELTVFKSLGLAVEDLAAAAYLFRRAGEEGAGTTVAF